MKFCPKCHNSFNISKSIIESNVQVGGDMTDEEIVTLIVNNLPVDPNVLQKMNIENIKTKSYFRKLNSTDRDIVINTISHSLPKNIEPVKESKIMEHNIAYFKCTNCGYYEQIKPRTLVFSKVNSGSIQDILIEDYSCMIYDTTLPRTKEYICDNEQCITHKKPEQKEAVFFRARNSYQLIYICTVCKTNWLA